MESAQWYMTAIHIYNIYSFLLSQTIFLTRSFLLFFCIAIVQSNIFIEMASNFDFRIPSVIENRLIESTKVLNKLKSELLSIDINQNQMSNVVTLIKELITENRKSIEYLLKNTATKPEKIVEDVFINSLRSFESIDSHYKR